MCNRLCLLSHNTVSPLFSKDCCNSGQNRLCGEAVLTIQALEILVSTIVTG
jgi:hypothetical protein